MCLIRRRSDSSTKGLFSVSDNSFQRLPRRLLISALCMSGCSSAIFLRSIWLQTMNAFMGRLTCWSDFLASSSGSSTVGTWGGGLGELSSLPWNTIITDPLESIGTKSIAIFCHARRNKLFLLPVIQSLGSGSLRWSHRCIQLSYSRSVGVWAPLRSVQRINSEWTSTNCSWQFLFWIYIWLGASVGFCVTPWHVTLRWTQKNQWWEA